MLSWVNFSTMSPKKILKDIIVWWQRNHKWQLWKFNFHDRHNFLKRYSVVCGRNFEHFLSILAFFSYKTKTFSNIYHFNSSFRRHDIAFFSLLENRCIGKCDSKCQIHKIFKSFGSLKKCASLYFSFVSRFLNFWNFYRFSMKNLFTLHTSPGQDETKKFPRV